VPDSASEPTDNSAQDWKGLEDSRGIPEIRVPSDQTLSVKFKHATSGDALPRPMRAKRKLKVPAYDDLSCMFGQWPAKGPNIAKSWLIKAFEHIGIDLLDRETATNGLKWICKDRVICVEINELAN
jgi:hypothetical protein